MVKTTAANILKLPHLEKKRKKKTTIISEKEIQYFSGFQDVFPNGGKQLVLVLVFTCQNKQKKQKKEKRFRRR